jgi:hypothetical protein
MERGHRLLSTGRRELVELFPLLAFSGGLLLLAGLLITHLWSWRVEGLVVQSGERKSVPGTDSWVALDQDAAGITHSAGSVAFVEARGPGVQVSATDDRGNPLALQQATEVDLFPELALALTEDQHFAIPDAQLIVHLAPQAGHPIEAHTPLLVQVYRYPPVRLETEAIVEGDAELTIDDVTLHLTSAPYAQVAVTFNPGLWPTGAGVALSVVGLGGSAVRSARRPRMDEED